MADPVTDTALASAAKGAGDAGAEAGLGGLGSFFGDLFGGGGDAALAGGAGADALGSAAADTPYAFNPGFSAGDLDYLGGGPSALGGGGDTAGATGAAGGFDPSTSAGTSAFDPGTYAPGAGSTTPDWLNGGSLFDTGVAGAAPAADFSGGVNSFAAPGVSSFADTMAAGGSGPQAATAFQGAGDLSGGASAFTPGAGIQTDISAIDPTSLAATGEATTPANATPTGGTSGATDLSSVNRSAAGNADLSGLDAAEKAVTDQYGAVNANSVPTAPGDVNPNAAAGTATTPAATTPAAAAGSGSKFLGMDIGKPTVLGSAGALLSGGLLAKNLLTNTVPGQAQVNAIQSNIPQVQGLIDNVNQTAAQLRAGAAPVDAQGQQMMSYLSQGKLPDAMQAQVTAGISAAKAQAASVMAQHGLSADPRMNAQLKQQFDTIDSQGLQLQATMANQLYQSGLAALNQANQTQQTATQLQNTGLNAVGLTQNTYLALQKIYADQDKQTQAAVTNFASALGKMSAGGSGSGTTIKIGSA